MELLLQIGQLAERPGIEIARLGPDLDALAPDLDFQGMELAVPALRDGIAEHVISAGHGLQVVHVVGEAVDVGIVFAAGRFGQAAQGIQARRAVIPVDEIVVLLDAALGEYVAPVVMRTVLERLLVIGEEGGDHGRFAHVEGIDRTVGGGHLLEHLFVAGAQDVVADVVGRARAGRIGLVAAGLVAIDERSGDARGEQDDVLLAGHIA